MDRLEGHGAPADGGHLHDAARLAALRNTGLTARPDEALDRFAELVCQALDVPGGLVALVGATDLVLPGAAGILEPQARRRRVVLDSDAALSGEPLIVRDSRVEPQDGVRAAIADLGVRAYAGMPLTDESGHVLGFLCALDRRPRDWTAPELGLLTNLAAACSSELRLRISVRRAELADQRSIDASAAHRHARAEATRLAGDVDTALRQSQLLLSASEALQGALTVDDVVHAVATLVSGDLAPVHVGVMLLDTELRRLTLVASEPLPPGPAERWMTVPAGGDQPAARAVREQRPLFFPDREAFRTAFPDRTDDLDAMGWQALVCAPLLGGDGPLGTLRLAWAHPQRLDVGERAVVLSLAGYVTQALERARHLEERITAAETLQRAMLSALPTTSAYELAARYQPAHRVEQVGGDWYDALLLSGDRLALVIGDVTGHDIGAAARMGQLRNMLRAYLVEEVISPAEALHRLERANHALGDRTLATALVATVERHRDRGYLLCWSPAGHPPPIVLGPDGRTRALGATGLMIGVRSDTPRATHTESLPAGSTLLLYTDGLVERRAADLLDGIAQLRRGLTANRALPLEQLLDALLEDVPGTGRDDIAVLAVRLP